MSTSGAQPKLASLRISARAEALGDVRRLVRRVAAEHGLSSEDTIELTLAIDEACANVIRHAYGEAGAGDMVLDVEARPDELVFRLTDFAPPVDQRKIKPRDLDDVRPGGLGVHFIRSVMDEMRFVDPPPGAGNVLEMTKKLQPK